MAPGIHLPRISTNIMSLNLKLKAKTFRFTLIVIFFLGLFSGLIITRTFAAGRTFYVSTTGNDSNAGSYDKPFKTFAAGINAMSDGDKLLAFPGTYYERISITKSGKVSSPITVSSLNEGKVVVNASSKGSSGLYIGGDYINIENLDILNSDAVGVDVKGSNINLKNINVYGSTSHGINFRGNNAVYENSIVTNNVLENEGNKGKWGSAIKVSLGGNNITIKNNKVYKNWGEGIALTRGSNVTVEANTVSDNFSANIYVDNSYNVNILRNFVTCSANSGFERDGQRAKGIMIGEESYNGWGSQLNNINIINNISAYCLRGFSFYSAEVSDAGLRNTKIIFNTFYGSTSYGIYIAKFPETSGSIVANNIISQGENKLAYIEDPKGIQFYNNLWSNALPSINAVGQNDKTGNVGFRITPSYNTSSFELSASSPSINNGASFDEVTNDFYGSPRKFGEASDIGAIEMKCPPLPVQYCIKVNEQTEPEIVSEHEVVKATPLPSPSISVTLQPTKTTESQQVSVSPKPETVELEIIKTETEVNVENISNDEDLKIGEKGIKADYSISLSLVIAAFFGLAKLLLRL